MARVAFSLTVRPELIDEYIARHSPVWPEMLAEIAAAGRRNYSLFLDRATATATYPGHEAHDWLRSRYASVTATYSALIAHDVAVGRLTTDGDPLELAGLVVTGWEGIQIRWLADGTDPVAAMGTLLSAVLRPAPTASHLHGRRGNQPESVHTSRILE
ncbi:L-rhamnose mutarotase [Microbacterium aurum]